MAHMLPPSPVSYTLAIAVEFDFRAHHPTRGKKDIGNMMMTDVKAGKGHVNRPQRNPNNQQAEVEILALGEI